MKLVKTRIPFDNGFFDYGLSSVELMLWNVNDNIIQTNIYVLITLNRLLWLYAVFLPHEQLC